MSRTVRVTVRGFFDGLSEGQLDELRAVAAEHDFMSTRYTAEGYLAYDLPARPAFTFRFAEEVESADEVAGATERARVKAEAWMAERGYPIKRVSTQTVDMAEVPLGKRGRREADRKS
jgi:hypothetical protein